MCRSFDTIMDMLFIDINASTNTLPNIDKDSKLYST